jgi:lipopolysaccharide transport system permease protein
VIEARPETTFARLKSLWRFRGFYGFLFKEITMRRARGSVLGFWSLPLRPLIAAAALIFAFGSVRPLDIDSGVPYPVFFLSGYIPWQLFQGSLRDLPRTLTWSQSIMRRTYFPRLLVPLAGFGMPFIEFVILSAVFAAVVAITSWSGAPFPLHLGWHTLWLLPCLLAALLFALAFGLVFSVVALFFRDVIFSLRFFSQVLLFLTPVIYPVTLVPEAYRWALFVLNPMAQIVIVSRWALTGHGELHLPFLLLSFGTVLVTLAVSVVFFLRAEVHLGDQM